MQTYSGLQPTNQIALLLVTSVVIIIIILLINKDACECDIEIGITMACILIQKHKAGCTYHHYTTGITL